MAETVRVRVAVAVGSTGIWSAGASDQFGGERAATEALYSVYMRRGRDDDAGIQIYWLTADLPLPTEPEVAARVEGEG